jgi:predicted Zn-dependent protease
MKRLLLVVAVMVGSSGCAVFSAAARGDVGGALSASRDVAHDKAGAAAQAAMKASADDDKYCVPLKTKPVGYPEERALGGAVLIQQLKTGFFIDHDDDENVESMNKKVKAGTHIELPASDKNDLTTYVERVGANLAGFSSRPNIPWAFGVVDSPDINAFSAPGGYVTVTTGLLKATQNEAQLAGVLAHEIAHVTGRHSLKTYQEQRATVCSLMVKAKDYGELGISELPAGASDWAQVALDGMTVIGPNGIDLDSGKGGFLVKIFDFMADKLAKSKERDQEMEADLVGIELVAAAGYDTAEYGTLLKKLPTNGGLFANHPPTADRIAALDKWRSANAFSAGNAKPSLEATKALK